MITYFISDLHLAENRPDITHLFIDFIEQKASQAAALYILGDFFEYWIGDDISNALTEQVSCALQQLTQQHDVSLYFMPGNRDFLIGEKFLQQCGAKLLADPCVINLYGEQVLLMHGDTLCTLDVNYLKFRKKIRQPWLQKLFLASPQLLRQKLANYLRDKSHHAVSVKAADIMDVSQEAVEQVMQQYQVKRLIHGHTHRPSIHDFIINDENYQRIVLGAWEEDYSALRVDKEEYFLWPLSKSQTDG